MFSLQIFPLYLSFFILIACSSGNEKVAFLEVHLDKKVSTLSDSTFFGDCLDVIYYNDHLLITDRTHHRLIACDTAFHILSSIGKAGKGPGEIMGPMRSYIKNNYIYNFDNGNKALSVFSTEGKFLKRITYRTSFIPFNKFAVDDSSKIFICSGEFDSPIAVLDTSGNIVRQFGTFFSSKSIKEQRIRSDKHIFLSNGQLICVGVSEPLIEIYTKSGKKVRKFNLGQNALTKKSIDIVESKRQKDPQRRENITSLLFGDAYLVNNHLYLLLFAANKTERIPDKILIYTMGTTLEFYKVIDLSEGQEVLWYKTFAISPDEKRIFAYAANRNEWRVFRVP